MKRLACSLLVVWFATGCAFVKSTLNQADPTRQYRERAAERCGPLKTNVVSELEEREIGGAIALGLANKTGGLFIELSPDLPQAALKPDEWKDRKVAAPTGEKAQLTAYLNRIGRYLSQFSTRPQVEGETLFHWTFVVLNSPSENAFSAPGGYVFVTTGLLKKAQNEAQLAAVLAHEIGHVTARDSIHAYQEGKYKACYVVSFGADLSTYLPNVPVPKDMMGGPAAALSREEQQRVAREFLEVAQGKAFNPSRASGALVATLTDVVIDLLGGAKAKEVELAADATSSALLTAAGYDRTQLQAIIKRLPDGGGLSPHPTNKDRIAALDALQKKDGDAFAGTAAPDNAEQLKAAKK